VISVTKEWTVVRGEDHQGVLRQVETVECREDLTDRPVEFLDHITVEPTPRFPSERI